jgi:hypothetical protein
MPATSWAGVGRWPGEYPGFFGKRQNQPVPKRSLERSDLPQYDRPQVAGSRKFVVNSVVVKILGVVRG